MNARILGAVLRFAYQRVLKPLLFRWDPEAVHHAFVRLGVILGAFGLGRWLTRVLYGYRGPQIAREVDGLRYRTPVLLAAGFDYNGHLVRVLPHMAFGGQEVGSVTARVCAGNAPPRMQRLIQSRSLVVYKGLKNDGVAGVTPRLPRRGTASDYIVGVSIARTNDAESADLAAGIEDYATSLQHLVAADIGDFFTINISCPNVHGGESFTDLEPLDRLLTRLDEIPHDRPVYVKLPINPPWPEIHAMLTVIARHRVHGVVIGNLNKDYQRIDPAERPAAYRGGISGPACFPLALALIQQTREQFADRFTILACGGIQHPNDAIAYLHAGADLVQLITGMIFEGPHLMRNICHAVAADKTLAARPPRVRYSV